MSMNETMMKRIDQPGILSVQMLTFLPLLPIPAVINKKLLLATTPLIKVSAKRRKNVDSFNIWRLMSSQKPFPGLSGLGGKRRKMSQCLASVEIL